MSNWGVQKVRDESGLVTYKVTRTAKGYKETAGTFRNAAEARNVADYLNRKG